MTDLEWLEAVVAFFVLLGAYLVVSAGILARDDDRVGAGSTTDADEPVAR